MAQVAAMARLWSLAQELPQAAGAARKKKKSKKKSVTLRKKVHITTEFVYIFLWKLDIKMGYINLQEDYCPTYEYSHSYTKDC